MSLQLCDVTLRYPAPRSQQQHATLGPLTLDVPRGAVTSLVGASGCGKSSAVRLLAGLVAPTSGQVRYDGQPLTAARRLPGHTALMTQHPRAAADPRMRIGRALTLAGAARQRDVDVATLLDEVGLDAQFATRMPHELSGGQLARAMLARALAQQPEFLLADEVTSHLDPMTTKHIAQVLTGRSADGLGVLLVTHDRTLASSLSQSVVELANGMVRA